MQSKVKAPDGYDGSRCYDDGARGWKVYARLEGRTWWTVCGIIGHSQTPSEKLDKQAEELIAHYVSKDLVK